MRIKIKDIKIDSLTDGLLAESTIGKKAKEKFLIKCQYQDCKVLIHRGKKYCSPHSYDKRLELNRKI